MRIVNSARPRQRGILTDIAFAAPSVAGNTRALVHLLATELGRRKTLFMRLRSGWSHWGPIRGQAARDAAQIGDDCVDVFGHQLAEALVDRFAHRTCGGPVAHG